MLGWLRSERLFPLFVGRRIAEVRSAEAIQFRYVQSKLNPADLATRQIIGNTLPELWINGPEFLTLPPQNWPIIENLQFTLPEIEEHGLMDAQTVDTCARDDTNHLAQMNYTNTAAYSLPSTGTIIPSPQVIVIQAESILTSNRVRLHHWLDHLDYTRSLG